MNEPAAVVTMVKDDYFFLKRWVAYYGGLFGKQALYVLAHGGDPEIARIAEGCNVIRIPPGYDATFNTRRAATFSSLIHGLKQWFDFVLITDVDEFIVLDPKGGKSLPEFLAKRKSGQVITPIGVEIIHRPEDEPDTIDKAILGPRRFARYSSFYCKPVIISKPGVRLSRGSHYATHSKLKVFRNLYLFHMKYCDRGMSLDTLRKRGKIIKDIATLGDGADTKVKPTQWGKLAGKEVEHLEKLSNMPVLPDWDFSADIARMSESWGPRNHDLYDFDRHEGQELHTLPERFFSLV